jgi:F-type H+-transporting ATPase subunit a
MSFFSPLEQFELDVYLPLGLLGVDFSLNTVSVYACILSSLLIFLFTLALGEPYVIPTRLQYFFEKVYYFVLTLLDEQTGKSGYSFFPLFFCIFNFILVSNLFGLIPFSFTLTANIAVTFSLALALNIAFVILGFYLNGLSFLRLFIPGDAPLFLLPLIVLIEVVSYLIRTLSLSVRLFANMMAGHTLLHILASFGVSFSNLGPFSFLPFFPILLLFLVFFLEFAIAFIQAYVFTILLCIYLRDSYFPGH